MKKRLQYEKLLKKISKIDNIGRSLVIFYLILAIIFVVSSTYISIKGTYHAGPFLIMGNGVIIFIIIISIFIFYRIFLPIEERKFLEYSQYAKISLIILSFYFLVFIMYFARLALFNDFNIPINYSGEIEYAQSYDIIIPIIIGIIIFINFILLIWYSQKKYRLLNQLTKMWYDLMKPHYKKYQKQYKKFISNYNKYLQEYYEKFYNYYYRSHY